MNADKIKNVLERAVQLVLSRDGDVDTEDGVFATAGTDEILQLEMAIVLAFELDSDSVDKCHIPSIVNSLSEIT